MSSERLYLTEPRRTTCLATVTEVRGEWFTLDRCLYAPTSKALRHPQPQDHGIVWTLGEKRNLTGVMNRDDGKVWLRLKGGYATLGAQMQCHLDVDRRLAVSRAHTAMHLLRRAFGDVPLLADPEVKLGGTFRLDFSGILAPARLAEGLAIANGAVTANVMLSTQYIERELLGRVAEQQKFDPPNPYPGTEPVVPVVTIPGYGAYPCDGTHVDRTGRIGRIVIASARPSGRRFTVVGKVMG